MHAYVKLLGARAFAVESVCAWLVRELYLPGPEPFWVWVHRNRVPQIWPYETDDPRLCFATKAIMHARPIQLLGPDRNSLTRQLGLDDRLIGRIATFDALIGNDDRHKGNLLWAPPAGVLLIDHEQAIGGVGFDLFSTLAPAGGNHFLEKIKNFSAQRRHAIKADLVSFCASCADAVERLPYSELVPSPVLRAGVQDYLLKRADRLFETVSSALGMPELAGFARLDQRPALP
ncbi:MAG: hypothetical protein ACRYG5_11290 [Janthinobacterium lividum]